MHKLMARQQVLINQFFSSLDPSALEMASLAILKCEGTIFFTGVGKSGYSAELLATLFASIGIKAFYLSPMNALHGDIGILSDKDLVIFLSKSGNTQELIQLVFLIKERNIASMGWFCQKGGRLSQFCQTTIYLPLEKELCPFDLSPTTSTILQLIFGNTLTVDLMEKKQFSKEIYEKNHPSGVIGQKMKLKVEDIMLNFDYLPICHEQDPVQDILVELSDKKCGCILVLDENQQLLGVFTDGDLRRAIKQDQDKVFINPVRKYMTEQYISIHPKETLVEAINRMQKKFPEKKISALPVIQEDKLLGLVRLQDIVSLGIN
ncbi:MAG: KpsF/GutQ family sugar-phosphate isomerase [Chlamydiae bacterium]|nr:KpsF/GutQ family sugar-phosphate isomerase [Chlamydiota bacterium]